MERIANINPPVRALLAAGGVAILAIGFARIPLPHAATHDESAPATVVASEGLANRAVSVPAPPSPAFKVSAAKDAQPAGKPAAALPQLARTGAIEVIAPDVERAIAAITSAGRRQGGVVTALSDERPSGQGEVHHAEVSLSVPASAFESTLAALASVARVRSRTIGAEDVGDKIVDDGARLRNLRRTELDLLKIMDRSGRVSEVLDVERELSTVREQIEQIDAELVSTQRRVARAQIDVSVIEDAPVRIVEPEVSAQLAGAWRAALDQVKAFTLAAIARTFVLIAFLPYLLALLLVFAGARALWRSRTQKSVAVSP